MLGFEPHPGAGRLEDIQLMDHESVAGVIKNMLDQ